MRIGPIVVEQTAPCPHCDGDGMTGSICPSCRGRCGQEDRAEVAVAIPAGISDGEKVVAAGCGHTLIGQAPGDVAVRVTVIPDARFERKGDNLVTDVEVPLATALCGGSFEVEHLDGRTILVSSAPGEVLAPGSGRALCGEGMPKRANPCIRGDLVLRIAVKFPDALSEAEVPKL
jgi:DnaJ-class molecular chaperone